MKQIAMLEVSYTVPYEGGAVYGGAGFLYTATISTMKWPTETELYSN